MPLFSVRKVSFFLFRMYFNSFVHARRRAVYKSFIHGNFVKTVEMHHDNVGILYLSSLISFFSHFYRARHELN